jgi:hypothetical protein
MKTLISLFLLAGILFTTDANILTIRENLFYLNGEHFEMWGLRTASATQSDALTDKLLDALDEYQEVGLNTISHLPARLKRRLQRSFQQQGYQDR